MNNSNPLSQDVADLSQALSAASLALLHGSRAQQIEAGNAARGLLKARGFSICQSSLLSFIVKARFANAPGTYVWEEKGLTSIDALSSVLEQIESHPRFAGKHLSITVLPETGSQGYSND